jgi:hypothetical protein
VMGSELKSELIALPTFRVAVMGWAGRSGSGLSMAPLVVSIRSFGGGLDPKGSSRGLEGPSILMAS